ncbi:hypothetical protein [Autumnicola psychrophila]|uniref:Acylneuraminate cytidylyltransferase family protein n=1 Tax=Autumnicola psychrophila TaxID=3075592 RepID=A0ABU3DS51_9FLAO|nr:hypothetical protein [Zunongwangia sp. F225]MDT0686551.1 hypothetical protein [Zunongwangia sp. F225]
MAISIFLPVRKGSERVKNKNTRKFSVFKGGLLELKLRQLKEVRGIYEIILSTNDEICRKIGEQFQQLIPSLRIEQRPDFLGSADTDLEDLIKHAGELANFDDILWTHVTSPLCGAANYENAVKKYAENQKLGYDSLISGINYKDFLIDRNSGRLVNNPGSLKWPRTQDLADWFELDNAIFITSGSNFKKGKRTGEKPYLLEHNKVNSIDVDYKEDFFIAEAVYERIYR